MHGAADLEVSLEVAESHARPRWRERPIRDPDAPEFQRLVRRQLKLLGENPDREGLQKTPERVATSLAWLIAHLAYGAIIGGFYQVS
jgi:GTP cyclohydrolase I